MFVYVQDILCIFVVWHPQATPTDLMSVKLLGGPREHLGLKPGTRSIRAMLLNQQTTMSAIWLQAVKNFEVPQLYIIKSQEPANLKAKF